MQKRLEKDKALLQQRVEQMEALLKEQESREERMNRNCMQLIDFMEEFEKRFSESGNVAAPIENNMAEYIGQSLQPLRNDYKSYIADSKVEAMKLSLSKIRYLSKEILQGRELMLLKSSQALLYKHQASIIATEDVNINRSMLGNRKLTSSNLNVSKFESCDYFDKIDNVGHQGPSNLLPILPVQSIVLDPLKHDSLLLAQQQSQNLIADVKPFANLKSDITVSPVIENRFVPNQTAVQLTEFKSETEGFEIVPFKIQSDNLEAKETTHVPFKYNRRFTIETPPLLEKNIQPENPLANSAMRIDSSRFNEFKKELMEFENSYKKIDSDLPSANMTLKKDELRSDIQLDTGSKNQANPTLLSFVDDFSSESKQNENLIRLDEISEQSEITIQKAKFVKKVPIVSRRDLFEFGKETEEQSRFSNSGVSNSKLSGKSFVSKKDLQRLLNDPANIFLKRKSKQKDEVPTVTNTPMKNSPQLSYQNSVSSIPIKFKSGNSPSNCSHNIPHCHCFSTPTIQININNNFLSKTPDFCRDSNSKRTSSPWMEGKSPKRTTSNTPTNHLSRLGINVNQKAANISVNRDSSKNSARNSLNCVGSFRKIMHNSISGKGSQISSLENHHA